MNGFKVEAVIFDFDGTICDSLKIKEEIFGELYLSYGEKIKKKVMEFHRENLGISRETKFIHFQKNIVREDYSRKTITKLSNKFSNLVKQKVIDAGFISGALRFLEKNFNILDLHLSSATPHEELIEILIKKIFLNISNLLPVRRKLRNLILTSFFLMKNFTRKELFM